ncbi:copper transport protein cch [Phtheirospermum japonicum]|uniref:Copper transport protein cch n=1 Tax=Phtheirospermum japonicum TaxID=374723 RepID=A0A830BZE1_9LAMI|nr:copper transport protein cch [Phtheirospermum japonicum]
MVSCCAGVDSFDIDMEKQKVTVIGNIKPEAVLQTVSKTGKSTSFKVIIHIKCPTYYSYQDHVKFRRFHIHLIIHIKYPSPCTTY